METGEIPNECRLKADISRVERLLNIPFGKFIQEQDLHKLDTSKSRSILSSVLRRHLVEIDTRIRFVEASADGNPNGTMKFSSVEKAIHVSCGWRLLRLLGGGLVPVTVKKEGLAKEWRIVSLKSFMPTGEELKRHENDIEALLRVYLRNPIEKKFPATTIGAFQIRTGPSRYDLYLMAHDYFAKE